MLGKLIKRFGCFLLAIGGLLPIPSSQAADEMPLSLSLRKRHEIVPGCGLYQTVLEAERWLPTETALIVCDVWDLHHCRNAVRRAEEFAPRLNQVVKVCRSRGVTIIHAPSDCMAAYTEHPARKRAMATPRAADFPPQISEWCKKIPAEEQGVYPIDQTDGGEDDDLAEHAAWAKELTDRGLNPKRPWTRQSPLIEIDNDKDFVSDGGEEVWSILAARGIKNVILSGVHTNMCVLGRPFGLRQMSKNGKRTALLRDMTDTMYNPEMQPFVSHFTGTDLIIAHIEKFVCRTITSNQILGDSQPFRFAGDKRKHAVVVISEDEYETKSTLPTLAATWGRDFRVDFVFGHPQDGRNLIGIEALRSADVVVLSVRRRVLLPETMAEVRAYLDRKGPLVGIRTANHAFLLRGQAPPVGYVEWPDWDAAVFGGSYTNHYANDRAVTVELTASEPHPLLTGIERKPFTAGGSLYRVAPVNPAATVLLMGRVEGEAPEPVAWTFTRANGGKSFYTSLGHRADFEQPTFTRLLQNAVYWAADLPLR